MKTLFFVFLSVFLLSVSAICGDYKTDPTIRISIENKEAFPGQEVDVSINIQGYAESNQIMGGFDFLIEYDNAVLNLQGVNAGSLLQSGECNWEYFTYRAGANGNCGNSACPSGMIRIVALADMNNGPTHPNCYGPEEEGDFQLAELSFLITDNQSLECVHLPIRWKWYDCGDNTIANKNGDSLFASRDIYNLNISDESITDTTRDFPSYYGVNYTCDLSSLTRIVDFWNGGIDLPCEEDNTRGDINLNDMPYEIADLVLFSNYFVYGLSAFDDLNTMASISASDVNDDGISLSLADFIYLMNIIQGVALPNSPVPEIVDIYYSHDNSGIISINNDIEVGALYVIVEGDITPTPLNNEDELKYYFNGTNTKCLIVLQSEMTESRDIIDIDGNIVQIEMATKKGGPVNAILSKPVSFVLNQNYPNPFNPATIISFDVAHQCEYSLDIYNINGQLVERFNGTANAGQEKIVWNATDQSSGVYLYKLKIDNYTATRKNAVT